ncbi:S8 family peptidase [Clostridium sp. HMP27]|uniref:S8 family peptidase n=1 Tax=Clostridium sp. HMP27 TaxID=1487921 RepID=UPI000A6B3FA4|nr:S8 family peptidase [Clostridium sp. HMP27]
MLNLLINVPQSVLAKLAELSKNEQFLTGKVELTVIYNVRPEEISSQVAAIGGTFEDLGYNFGIVVLNVGDIERISEIRGIQYLELPRTVYTSDLNSNRASCVPPVWSSGLTGKGTLVGFIDSGIDYTSSAFINEDGTTRIDYIYDLSQGGMVYNRADINRALQSGNPFSIVQQRDTLGHGTHVAGIACAGGKISRENYGVAFESSIAMVKITAGGQINYTKDTLIMRGIKFLLEKAVELNKPLIINLSFSTNDGSHTGSTLFEQYIDTVCRLNPISFVVAAGNEGDKAHHAGGELRQNQTIPLNIAPDERGILFQIYKPVLNDITIQIVNPSGIRSEQIRITEGYKEGTIGQDRYYVYYTGPKPYNMNGEIIISLIPTGDFLTSGIWNLNITSQGEYQGRYNIWLPITEGLNPNTKFLEPEVYFTIGIPATVESVFSVGSYNGITNTISSFSGRGELGGNIIKPDLVAPGEDIQSVIPGGRLDTKSGTSMAAPHVSGICSLFMQWGMVDGNDPFLYGERLKYYLARGANKDRPQVIYPNPTWGYGQVCAQASFDLLRLFRGDLLNINDNYYDKLIREQQEVQPAPEGQTSPEAGGVNPEPILLNYLVEYDGDIVARLQQVPYASAAILDENYAIISVERGRETEILRIPEVVYVDRSSLYTLMQTQPQESANIYQFHVNPYLNLLGTGVYVGIIDTGIDYLNKEFMYEDDTTKILSIWDQSDNEGTHPKGLNYGTEYNRAQINEAITISKNQGDPYRVVRQRDTIGHGTQMAGIIGARGYNKEIIGAAPDVQFIVVKLRQASADAIDEGIASISTPVPVYEGTDIITAIRYVSDVAKSLNKPTVIFIPLGTNCGPHDGNTIIERYIDEVSKVRGIAVVTGVGNEGDENGHTSGTLEKQGDRKVIELNMAPEQRSLVFQIWVRRPDVFSIGIVSPSGETIDRIPAKLQEVEQINLVFERSRVFVEYSLPEELTGDELILIRIENARPGVWQFVLYGDLVLDGRYDAWLPQKPLVREGTRFLNPTPFVTIQTPATARQVLVAAFYNQNTNAIVVESGRGYTRDGRVVPNVAAGGINAKTTAVGGGVTTISGSSVAAAVYAGACALLYQWGLVDGNDPSLFVGKMKTYFIRGARRRQGDIYPNPEWGYGQLDLERVFETIRAGGRGLDETMLRSRNISIKEDCIECNIGEIFLRIPKDI